MFAFEEVKANAQCGWKISDTISFQANEERKEHRIFSDTLQEGRKIVRHCKIEVKPVQYGVEQQIQAAFMKDTQKTHKPELTCLKHLIVRLLILGQLSS